MFKAKTTCTKNVLEILIILNILYELQLGHYSISQVIHTKQTDHNLKIS